MKKNIFRNPYEHFSKFAISVLKQVENHIPIEQISIKNRTSDEIQEFLYLCAKSGYINCVACEKTADFKPHFAFVNGLTIEGYRFLNEMYADSARKAARKANITSIASLIISFLSLAICFITLICEYFLPC